MKFDILLIGGSAGGVDAFQRLLRLLPDNFPLPIVIVHHVPRTANISHQVVYGSVTSMPVLEAEEKMKLEPGKVYFAPPDYHLLIERNLTASLDFSDPVNFSRPAIDVTFASAAHEFQSRAIAVLVTGASNDGAQGLLQLKECGAYTVVQAPSDASSSFMPESSLRLIEPNFVGTIEQIAEHLKLIVGIREGVRGIV